MAVLIERRLFTRPEYHAMVQAGILSEDDPVELLQGEIVHRMPTGASHASCVKRLNHLLSRLAGDAAIVSVQDPLGLDEYSESEPDLMLLRPRRDYYAGAHPAPNDVLLVIEVADTSLAADMEVKVPLYARHGLCEVWLVDLEQRRVIAYRNPVGGHYQEERVYEPGESLPVSALSGKQIPIDALGL